METSGTLLRGPMKLRLDCRHELSPRSAIVRPHLLQAFALRVTWRSQSLGRFFVGWIIDSIEALSAHLRRAWRKLPLTPPRPARGRVRNKRSGKILVFMAVLLPTLAAVAGLTIDVGLLHTSARSLQQTCDAAATAAAVELRAGNSSATAIAIAQSYVQQYNDFATATVQVNVPPHSGPYQGLLTHVEVIATQQVPCYFMPILSASTTYPVRARSTAGVQNSTAAAAIAVLDPDPPPFQIGSVNVLLPPLPAILGGLEVLGVGRAEVDGAVLVNTTWGGKDENGNAAGSSAGLPYAVCCTPIISLDKLTSRNLYVVGGVDNPGNYTAYSGGGTSPLSCNRMPIVDPLKSLPVPTTAVDATNVVATNYGGKSVIGIPLIGPPVTLQPGVYDYIEVVSGIAVFQPGVYVIRGKHPITQLSLSVVAGRVNANGVMFYITDSASFSVATGAPDAADGETSPPNVDVTTLLPSTVVNIGVLGSTWRGLNAPGSPLDGMLIYQRRRDRRPIVLVQENLLAGGAFSGTAYSKWGHIVLAGKGDYAARFVAGTLRIVPLLDLRIVPSTKLPAATDVFLME